MKIIKSLFKTEIEITISELDQLSVTGDGEMYLSVRDWIIDNLA